MLHYIIQVVAFQLLFLIIYDVFLRKETFFNLNRVYLLGTSVLSLAIPFIKIDRIKDVVSKDFVISLPEVLIGESTKALSAIDPQIAMEAGINLEPEPTSLWNMILIFGMCIATLILVYKIIKLVVLASNNPKYWSGSVLIVCLLNSTNAFSFFNYIFLGNQLSEKDSASILEHEMVHIKQRHSLDLLFFELLRIVFWFNPLVYIFQNRMATLHEYIADAKAVKGQNKADYYDNLLTQVFDTQQFSFVNPFFKHSLIKKRIVMLSKSKSNQINLMKYALLIPLVFIMLMYTSSYAQEKVVTSSSEIENQDSQELTDEALYDKYFNEIIELDENGATFDEIYNIYEVELDNYILPRKEYYKQNALHRFIFSLRKDQLKEDVILNEKDKKQYKKFSEFKPYKNYLNYKKSQKAKDSWESAIKDGILRLVVDDIGNMTNEENKKFNKKLEFFKKDPFYKGVLVMSSNGITQMIVDDYNPAAKKVIIVTDDIEIIEVEETVINDSWAEIPFLIVEETPTFMFCEALETNEERKKCLSDNISKYVAQNFNTKLADSLGLVGRQRINVIFKIDRRGDIIDVKARAPHPALEKEAIRVIKTLPQFIPGKQKGVAVTVPYSLPIVFQVKGDTKTDEVKEVLELERIIKLKEELKNSDEVPFVALDKAPLTESCKNVTDEAATKACFSDFISQYVNKNFNTDLATQLGLIGRQRINVIFQIDKDGFIKKVKARAPHPDLEVEAKRVISSLPQFKPGEMNGKAVIVNYSLPILFQVQGSAKENKNN
jgi:bla regulator protein BlaR1